jgi:hypothetical protein
MRIRQGVQGKYCSFGVEVKRATHTPLLHRGATLNCYIELRRQLAVVDKKREVKDAFNITIDPDA